MWASILISTSCTSGEIYSSKGAWDFKLITLYLSVGSERAIINNKSVEPTFIRTEALECPRSNKQLHTRIEECRVAPPDNTGDESCFCP